MITLVTFPKSTCAGLNLNVPKQVSADERLRKLKKLHNDGIISDEEFKYKKKEILDEL